MTPDTETRPRKKSPDVPDDAGASGGRGLRGWWRRRSRKARVFFIVAICVPALVIIAAAGLIYAMTKVPLPQSVNTAEVSSVTYRDGRTEIMKIGSINRINVPLSAVSLDAQHAVLAAEDKNFYSESGISWTGILRALWADVRGKDLQGGSTITQQYAKNAYLSQSRTFSRKLKEIAIAIKLSHKYSHDQILEFYLNTIYFGRGAYGIETAAQTYFGVPAKQLTAAQGAVLAGLIRAPSILDPRIDPSAAQRRFEQVVKAMASKNWITQQQAATLRLPATLPLRTTGPNVPHTPQDAYIRDEIMRELQAHGISEDEITRGGLKIATTLDQATQQAAVDSVTATFAYTPPDVQPALVAIQPGTGEVRAWYGGRYYGKGPNGITDYVDNVTDPIQPGSSFKPIALAAALTKGISLNSVYNGNDHQVITPGYPQGVPNYGGENLGAINLLQGTAMSVNSVFVALGRDAGTDNVIQTAHALGIPQSEKLPAVDSLPLGVTATSPLNMTDVYATFAAQGVQAPAHLVASVTDHNGNVIFKASTQGHRVLSPSVAADETYALQQPFQYGTAAGLAPPGRPVAGKTGTTDNNVSTWLCGYTPQLASCVAVARTNHNQSLNGIFNTATEATGASTAGHTWQQFMTTALANQPVVQFPAPAWGGTVAAGHAPPPPPPPPTTAPPSAKPSATPSAKPTTVPTTRPAPTTPVTPQPTAPPSSSGLLGGVLGGGGGNGGGAPRGGGGGPPG